MDKVAPKDQSPTDLVLHLIEGSILSENHFTVLETGEIQCPGLFVRAEIIGASHVIHFTYQKESLCEVFACLPKYLPGKQLIHKPISGCRDQTLTMQAGPVAYAIRTQIKDWRTGAPFISVMEAQIHAGHLSENGIGLIYEFPKVRSDHGPKTLVKVMTDRQHHVRVETLHGYPNKDRVVLTHTAFDF